MPQRALLNGRETPAGQFLLDRACQYGDGLFETLAIVDGRPALFERHLQRLIAGCDRLDLPRPDGSLLFSELASLAAGLAFGVAKLVWSAGPSSRGYRRPSELLPSRFVMCSEMEPPVANSPVSLRSCAWRMSSNPALAGFKHLNRLDQVLARAEWDDEDIFDGLVCDQRGNVVEGTMSNLLVQRGGRLKTPAINDCGVRGVVRDLAIELAAQEGASLEEDVFAPQDILQADALYLTNSVIGVLRVARVDATRFDLSLAPHPLIAKLALAAFLTDAP